MALGPSFGARLAQTFFKAPWFASAKANYSDWLVGASRLSSSYTNGSPSFFLRLANTNLDLTALETEFGPTFTNEEKQSTQKTNGFIIIV